MLTIAGYRVMVAANGREALETAKNHLGVISLLCTDIEMPPGIDGLELGLQLTAQRPEIKVLHLTGCETKMTSALRKPFTAEQLIARVREVLAFSVPLNPGERFSLALRASSWPPFSSPSPPLSSSRHASDGRSAASGGGSRNPRRAKCQPRAVITHRTSAFHRRPRRRRTEDDGWVR